MQSQKRTHTAGAARDLVPATRRRAPGLRRSDGGRAARAAGRGTKKKIRRLPTPARGWERRRPDPSRLGEGGGGVSPFGEGRLGGVLALFAQRRLGEVKLGAANERLIAAARVMDGKEASVPRRLFGGGRDGHGPRHDGQRRQRGDAQEPSGPREQQQALSLACVAGCKTRPVGPDRLRVGLVSSNKKGAPEERSCSSGAPACVLGGLLLGVRNRRH